MLFNTIEFIIFLPVVIIFYYLLPAKYRWMFLLAASYYFYMCWKIEYIFLIITSTLIDYFSGIQMEKRSNPKARLFFLVLSLCTNLGLLFAFKYFNFFSESVNVMFSSFNISEQLPFFKVLLPVGISFYTFQTMSYSIDVYYGRQRAEKHLGYFALYVSFFPQLVAGPIERFSRLTPQLKQKHSFSYENLSHGLRLILYGLFIKMVIADNLSVFVDQVYASPADFSSPDIAKALIFYSFQIYCDFYGYTSVALGSAMLMGIRIMQNFKTPYLSQNIAEFWQRWHISLSTWFRDYLYFPLGGSRVKVTRWVFNIMVVFVVSGLWHGASWTFLIWGACFGLVYLIEKAVNGMFNIKSGFRAFSAGHLMLAFKTFIIVTLIWIFFRSQSFSEAMFIFESLFTNGNIGVNSLNVPLITWIMLGAFILSDLLIYNKEFDLWIGNFKMPVRWSIYSILIFSIIVFSGVENFPFIYFQF